MRYLFIGLLLFVNLFVMTACTANSNSSPQVAFVESENKIDILIDGKTFSSYIIASDYLGRSVTKPILFPVHTPAGVTVTRSFPFAEVEGESPDHPHHTGIFFTYDEVNGSGFWNNTKFPPQIKHMAVLEQKGGATGLLKTESKWISKDSVPLLKEERSMEFIPGENQTIVDFTMTLTALAEKVEFGDTKEGMFAIRTAHQLREKDYSGRYTSSNGDTSAATIWGKRASWVKLEGTIKDAEVGIAILCHPTSTNAPTFWHARDYGLFSANPLGQFVFEKATKVDDPKPFALTLAKGESALFKFRVVIYDGPRSSEQIEEIYQTFAQ
jgi:hypothetical protein